MAGLHRFGRWLASLKLAVLVLSVLAAALATGTILESIYDTPTAQFWVYRATWFRLTLLLLGINIFAVMVDRWPWKPRHTPFVLAHIGILILLFGSWLTDRYGLDGMMRVSEGETSNSVEVDAPHLYLSDGSRVQMVSVPWMPPGVKFRPFSLRSKGLPYDIRVEEFISHADPIFEFPARQAQKERPPTPALRLKLAGGPMRVSQEFWLWLGQPAWNLYQAGPAWFGISKALDLSLMPSSGPRILLSPQPNGVLKYWAFGSSGEKVAGRIGGEGKPLIGQQIPVPWKGGVALTVLDFVPDANLRVRYKPSHFQYREAAPPSAIRMKVVGGPGNGQNNGEEAWLGLGDRTTLQVDGKPVELGYFRRRVILPFSLRLEKFSVGYYEGSTRPASYSSVVKVVEGKATGNTSGKQDQEITISMNEPLETGGITFYQASFEDGVPRPVTSIFSVNQDPGRIWKYLGSLLIVIGSVLLFVMKSAWGKKLWAKK